MLNKDKRSLLLSFILGDGCLHYIKNRHKIYGGITIDHGMEQADYNAWKASMISHIVGRDVKVRVGHKGQSNQISVCMKRFRAWRKFTYPNDRKSIPRILKFINHPEFALAVWLMDDGYVESSMTNGKNYSAALRLFICSQTQEECDAIQKWLKDNFDIDTKIKFTHKKGYKPYPFVKINHRDSLKVWAKIRDMVLQFKSMQYKFRYLEDIYNIQLSQCANTD